MYLYMVVQNCAFVSRVDVLAWMLTRIGLTAIMLEGRCGIEVNVGVLAGRFGQASVIQVFLRLRVLGLGLGRVLWFGCRSQWTTVPSAPRAVHQSTLTAHTLSHRSLPPTELCIYFKRDVLSCVGDPCIMFKVAQNCLSRGPRCRPHTPRSVPLSLDPSLCLSLDPSLEPSFLSVRHPSAPPSVPQSLCSLSTCTICFRSCAFRLINWITLSSVVHFTDTVFRNLMLSVAESLLYVFTWRVVCSAVIACSLWSSHPGKPKLQTMCAKGLPLCGCCFFRFFRVDRLHVLVASVSTDVTWVESLSLTQRISQRSTFSATSAQIVWLHTPVWSVPLSTLCQIALQGCCGVLPRTSGMYKLYMSMII